MKRGKLEKAKGRYQSGERFARLPREVLESISYRSLPDYSKCVVVAMAAQYRGIGNGDISLTWPESKALGVSAEWKLRAGIKLAERVGLIEITRPGGNVAGGEKRPTLYALGWLPIERSDKYDAPAGSILKAPNRWATWVPPDDWGQQIQAERRKAQGKNWHHTRAGLSAPPVRDGGPDSRYIRVGQEGQFPATHEGATSRDLGRGLDGKALGLIRSQPHLSDFDVAKALGWKLDPYRVRALREGVSQDHQSAA